MQRTGVVSTIELTDIIDIPPAHTNSTLVRSRIQPCPGA
jgi:hypothetical protein